MLAFNIKNFHVEICFGFFFVTALSSLRDNSIGLYSLLFCLLHEAAHLAMMAAFRVKIHGIKFYGGGIKISSQEMSDISKIRRAAIYLAGPAVNLFLGICPGLLNSSLKMLNIALGIFNLMPVYYFDGGRLLTLVAGERSLKIISAVFTFLLIAAALFIALTSPLNLAPSALITLIFIALSAVLDE